MFLAQVVLALCPQACQPSYLAQELPSPLIKMTNRNQSGFTMAFSLLFTLLLLIGCGGTEETKQAEASVTKPATTQPATTPRPANPSGKMAIPFEIAIQAALEGHVDTVKQALETGTDPNQVDENGRNMLMVAAFNGHNIIVEHLVHLGTKMDTRDAAGRTALMFASTGPNVPTVQLLLDKKAQVNLVDGEEHWSALMFAAAEGHREVVELLLQHDADLSLQDIDGSTAESFARDNGHIELADYLKELAAKQ